MIQKYEQWLDSSVIKDNQVKIWNVDSKPTNLNAQQDPAAPKNRWSNISLNFVRSLGQIYRTLWSNQ